MRKLATTALKDRVKAVSLQWKQQAIRTNRPDGKFCVKRGVNEKPEARESDQGVFVDWAKTQDAAANFDGTFTSPGEMLCSAHLIASITQSFREQSFTDTEATEILQVVTDLITAMQP
jgi:hypothetical protein